MSKEPDDFISETFKTFDQLFNEVFLDEEPTAPAEQDSKQCE